MIDLIPASGVELVDGWMVARALPAWLTVRPVDAIRPGRWLRLRYSTSLFDENVRPLIRITGAGGVLVEPMNGTLHGVGEWIGRIPDRVSTIDISPVARTGPFEFRIDDLHEISAARLALRGILARPHWMLWALRTYLGGARGEACRALRFAAAAAPLDHYHRWHRRLSRPLDPDGLERPRPHWAQGPAFRLFMVAGKGDAGRLGLTLRSLRAQVYPRWSLHCVVEESCPDADRQELRRLLTGDDQLHEVKPGVHLAALMPGGSSSADICGVIKPGDTLPDYALAAVAETVRANPAAVLFYGDEDSLSASGRLHSPRLLPDWSPHSYDQSPYLGDAVWFLASELAAGDTTVGQWLAAKDDNLAKIVKGKGRDAVCHVRRILYRHAAEEEVARNQSAPGHRPRDRPSHAVPRPEVAVIVLTRDNPGCLSQCVAGLTQATDHPDFRVTIVDNGSTNADALALLRDLRRHPRVDVLDRPGPFNFSALCNDAARATRAPVLLFLNDDIVIREPGWMSPLVEWSLRPEVGAVGAKLLFPDGAIQHAGVTLGLGGIAGHLYRKGSARQRGYLDGLTAAREVSAVTAACMAVERRKFEEVGGFDADNLPVELNDVDLCLRLNARGYATIWTPESVLIHHESATRGDSAWSAKYYESQRQYFVAKWQEAIRDDPYFHPSLSLFSYQPALAR